MMKRLSLVLVTTAFFSGPAGAQYQTQAGAISIGRGAGVVGDSSLAPGAAGSTIVSNGNAWTVIPGATASIIVTTIAALRALPAVTDGAVVDVLYYAQPGDEGGGRFVAQIANPGADNNGTIIWSATAGLYYKRVWGGGPVFSNWFGMRYNTFNQDAIQTASTVAIAYGTWLQLEPITFTVQTLKTKSPLGALRYYAIDLASNADIRGVPGLTSIKIADSQSILGNVKDVNIYVVDGVLSNIKFYGIDFDCNGANNVINGGFQCNGALNVTGDTAFISNMVINYCVFRNCAGTNNIVLGQNTNGVAGTLSDQVRITNCYFTNNGLDTPDHTTVYGWCENLWVEQNYFFQPPGLSRVGKNWVALELHGSNTWYQNNTIVGYYRGCWLASNFTRSATNLHVHNNRFEVWGVGVGTFRELASLTSVYSVHVTHNTIFLLSGNAPDKYGIACNTLFSISDINFCDNIIEATGTGYNSYGISIGAGNTQVNTRIRVQNNTVKFCNQGTYARVNNGDGTLDEIIECGNEYYGLGNTDGAVASVGSMYFQAGTGVINRVESYDNRYIAVGGIGFDTGLQTVGTVADANFDRNYFTGITTPINLATITAGRGKQSMRQVGTTAQRPAYLGSGDNGATYYDTTLSKVIMWDGTALAWKV